MFAESMANKKTILIFLNISFSMRGVIELQAGSNVKFAALYAAMCLFPPCTKCIDACPTQAILPNKTIEANHCISYYTIELKKQTIETSSDRAYQDWAFGCDICQDVCPWNRFSHPHQESKFKPIEGLLSMSKDAWLEMEETSFKARFKKSPLLRSKLKGIKRNIEYLRGR